MRQHVSGIRLLIAVVVFQSACGQFGRPTFTDDELGRFDPKGVVEVYWHSALNGDKGTITRIVGYWDDSMHWECLSDKPPDPKPGDPVFVAHGQENLKLPEGPISDLENILVQARVIEIARESLYSDYTFSEIKTFGTEARILIRPKKASSVSESLVFFLLKGQHGWKIVEIKSEDHLIFVGNKKFGEPRTCDPVPQPAQ